MLTTSYDTSVRLKEIGLKQESHFYWYDFRQGNPSVLACEDSEFVSQGKDDPSAYTSDELLELIKPECIDIFTPGLEASINIHGDTPDTDNVHVGMWPLTEFSEALAQAIIKATELKIDILKS